MVNALTDHLKIPLVIGCLSHTVNLCVDNGFQMQRVSQLVAELKHVVEHFTCSSKAYVKFSEQQSQL